MKQDGKFIVLTLDEFKQWLSILKVTRKISLIQNHHTYLPDYKSWLKHPDAIYWMRSMEQSHKERGFEEIAQNLTTFPDGTICIGRSFDKVPAGIKGANTNGICIEHLGNFDRGGDQMTAAHSNTIVHLNGLLAKKFMLRIDRNSIVYHHWYNLSTGVKWVDTDEAIVPINQVKSCPGSNFFGGNKPKDAESNFYPLIDEAIQRN